jgi:hypothetical protein
MHDSDFEGIRYSTDYTIYYTDRSIVDKVYVDTQMINFSSGKTYYPKMVWMCRLPKSYEELLNDISFEDYA